MSSTALGQYTMALIVYMESLYEKYKTNIKQQATVAEFEDALNNFIKKEQLTSKAKEFFENERKTLTFNVALICKSYDEFKTNSDSHFKKIEGNSKTVRNATTSVLAIAIFAMTLAAFWYNAKNSLSWDETIQAICIYAMICVGAITLYIFIINSNKSNEASAKKTKERNDKLYADFVAYIRNGENNHTIDSFDESMKIMVKIGKQGFAKVADIGEIDEDTMVKKYFTSFAGKLCLNVYNHGNGREYIEVLEKKGDSYETYKGITDVLEKYYDMMLMSSNFDKPENMSGVEGVLDNIVVKEIAALDLTRLDNKKTYDNAYITKMLKDSEDFKLFRSSIKYTAIYMYLFYSVIDFDDVDELLEKGLMTQIDSIKDTELTPQQADALERFKKSTELFYVIGVYPTSADRYLEELKRKEAYKEVPAYAVDIPKIDEFISFSASAMQEIYTNKNKALFNKYLAIVDNEENLKANNPTKYEEQKNLLTKQKKDIFDEYVSEFNSYFKVIYDKLIINKFAGLNPLPNQYFMFQDEFMSEVLDEIFAETDLQPFQQTYVKLFKDTFKEKIMKVQEASFKQTYTGSSLAEDVINKNVAVSVQKVAVALVPFNISLSDQAPYLKDKIRSAQKQTTSFSAAVNKKYDEIFAKIEQEVELNRKEAIITTRFIPLHTFVGLIDNYSFATLQAHLQVDYLAKLMTGVDSNAWVMNNETVDDTKGKWWRYYSLVVVIMFFAYVFYVSSTTGFASIVASGKSLKNALSLPNEEKSNLADTLIKVVVPLCIVVMIASTISSKITTTLYVREWNNEILKKSTDAMKTLTTELKAWIDSVNAGLKAKPTEKIGAIKELTYDKKYILYQKIQGILSNFDRTNYILKGHSAINDYMGVAPFPYTEVCINLVFIALLFGCIVYVLKTFKPLSRIEDLKELYEYKSMAELMSNDPGFTKEIVSKYGCFAVENKNTKYALKLLSVIGLVGFAVFYSVIMNVSSKGYQKGVKNHVEVAMKKSKVIDRKGKTFLRKIKDKF